MLDNYDIKKGLRKWEEISKSFPERTPLQCKMYYNSAKVKKIRQQKEM